MHTDIRTQGLVCSEAFTLCSARAGISGVGISGVGINGPASAPVRFGRVSTTEGTSRLRRIPAHESCEPTGIVCIQTLCGGMRKTM